MKTPVDQKQDKQVMEEPHKNLIAQINAEYKYAYEYMKPRYQEWGIRLKMYNNQRRKEADKEAFGDPLMFTIHQTILAALYDDRLMVEFLKKEEGDTETARNLNALAEYDYDLMQKDILDYEFDFNATFFGRGLLLFFTWDRNTLTPMPENMDPMATLRDPMASSVNGDALGRGAARFLGREIRLTKYQIQKNKSYKLPAELKPDSFKSDNPFDNALEIRQTNDGMVTNKSQSNMGDNETYLCLEWFTHYQGKKVFVTMLKEAQQVLRVVTLDTPYWPIVDRSIYPVANDWDGVSVPDLLEDKQRQRAVIQNLVTKSMRASLYPMYLYNTNLIKNKADLNFAFNKMVPVTGDVSGAAAPLQRSYVNSNVSWILDYIEAGGQKATASPDLQQGALSADKRTATELNIVQQKVDSRYSLSAKIFGWSERRFWQFWHGLYKKHFKEGIDEKAIRLRGPLGSRIKKLTKENITTTVDPDITIESRVLAEAKKRNQLQILSNLMQTIGQDPLANKRYGEKMLAEQSGLAPDEIDLLLPPTPEEVMARKENESLDENKAVPVHPTDDDMIHITEHLKSADTPAQKKHIEAHKMAMAAKKRRPDLFAPSTQPGEVMKEEQPTGMLAGSYVGGGPMAGAPMLPPNA